MERLEQLLEEYLRLQIETLERAAQQAKAADESKLERERFLSTLEPPTVVVGVALAIALLVAAVWQEDIVALFAPGHTASQAAALSARLTGVIPASVAKAISFNDLKAALLALLGLVVAQGVINKTVATAAAVLLTNLLIVAEFILVSTASAHTWPAALIYVLVVIGSAILCWTILKLVGLDHLRVTASNSQSESGRTQSGSKHWNLLGQLGANNWIGAGLLLAGLTAISLGDAIGYEWLVAVGFFLAAPLLVWLGTRIAVWALDGVLTKPTLNQQSRAVVLLTPAFVTVSVVVLSALLNLLPVVQFLTTFMSATGILLLVVFIGWFVWAELGLDFFGRVLNLTLFGWLLAAVFFYGSDPVALLIAVTLAWTVPRSMQLSFGRLRHDWRNHLLP